MAGTDIELGPFDDVRASASGAAGFRPARFMCDVTHTQWLMASAAKACFACRQTRQEVGARQKSQTRKRLANAGQTVLYRNVPCWRALVTRASGPAGEPEDGEAEDGVAQGRAARGRAGYREACQRMTLPGQRTRLR
jgi:hypothetical protein